MKIPENTYRQYLEAATRFFQTENVHSPRSQADGKRLLMVIWRCLSLDTRQRFVTSLGEDLMPMPKPRPKPNKETAVDPRHMVANWPEVMRTVSDEDRGFALSVMKSRNDPEWWPSEKQIGKMQAIWVRRNVGKAA